jgi:hypothetical protein
MALRAGVGDALCLVELRGLEPLTPCMPSMLGWFIAPCGTSCPAQSQRSARAVEGGGVGDSAVMCGAVSGKFPAMTEIWTCRLTLACHPETYCATRCGDPGTTVSHRGGSAAQRAEDPPGSPPGLSRFAPVGHSRYRAGLLLLLRRPPAGSSQTRHSRPSPDRWPPRRLTQSCSVRSREGPTRRSESGRQPRMRLRGAAKQPEPHRL